LHDHALRSARPRLPLAGVPATLPSPVSVCAPTPAPPPPCPPAPPKTPRKTKQTKQHLQQLGDLRALATYEGGLRAALLLAAANTLEKLLRLSAVDPWAHDPGDGFPLLYVRSHAARLPASLVRDWLFRCRLVLQSSSDSGSGSGGSGGAAAAAGRLDLGSVFGFYAASVRGGQVGSALSDAHRAQLLRKAVHVFSARAGVARRRREAAALAAAAVRGGGVAEEQDGRQQAVILSPADVAGAPKRYERGGGGRAGGDLNNPALLLQQQQQRRQRHQAGPRRGAPGVQLRALAAEGLLLRPRMGPRLVQALADVLSDASYVHTVSLAGSDLEDDAVCAVVVACLGDGGGGGGGAGGGGGGGGGRGEGDGDSGGSNGGNPELALTHLDLSGNRVGPGGCACLARAMRFGPAAGSLRTLVLAGNPVRDEGAALLAEALRGMVVGTGGGSGGGNGGGASASSAPPPPPPPPSHLCALQHLDLSDTSVGPEGAIALGSALRQNASLRSLALAGSRAGAVGVEAVAKGLARAAGRSALLSLDVSRTGADDRSAAAIAAMLAAPGLRLRRLAMAQTGMTDAGAQLICAALSGGIEPVAGAGGGGCGIGGVGVGVGGVGITTSLLESIDVSGSPHMDPSWGRLLSHVLRGGSAGASAAAGGGSGGTVVT
jgi:hypothetical protein